jgi:Calcineurin-like phosphoesterase
MKTLFVGDIHGKVEVVERALAQEHPVIFVGDIADSFERPTTDHLKCFELIFKAIDEDKAACLYGNHELSYLMPEHRCSGWTAAMQAHMTGGLGQEINKRFKPFIFIKPNVLVTHAGLTRIIWRDFNLTLETLSETLTKWFEDINSPVHWIGQSRGGSKFVGGIFWCDFLRDFREIPDLIQIFGHTRILDLGRIGNSYCIDYNDKIRDKDFYLEV